MSEQESQIQQKVPEMIGDGSHISEESLEKMKEETYLLIRRFCTVKQMSDWSYELLLHDQTPIKFTEFKPVEVDRFCGLVREFATVLHKLIRNLSYESESLYTETDHVAGSIDFEKTRMLRQTDTSSVVCIQYSKNVFTHENVLLAALILGINTMATKFLELPTPDDKKEQLAEEQIEKLNGIVSYTSFLQRDRFVSKLARHYLENFQGIEYLVEKTFHRIRTGRLGSKYHPLLQFIKYWKRYNQILQEGSNPLNIKLPGLEHFKTGHRIYEIWTFYKTLSILFGDEQVQQKHGKNYSEFASGEYAVKYQFGKKIGWNNNGVEMTRRPDTAIKKHGEVVAVIDAKYSSVPDMESGEEDPQSSTPKTSIVNQMIIAMDYGRKNETADLGIVLFADKKDQERNVVIEKSSGTPAKKIHFLNMHPENNPEKSLKEVMKLIP